MWDGRKRSVFLTVAGPDGEVLEEDGAVDRQAQRGAAHLRRSFCRVYDQELSQGAVPSPRHGDGSCRSCHRHGDGRGDGGFAAALFVRRARVRPAGGAERSHRRDSIRARRRRRRYRQVLSQRHADTGVAGAARSPIVRPWAPTASCRRRNFCCSTNLRLTN